MVVGAVCFIRCIQFLDGLIQTAYHVFVHCELLKHLSDIFDGETIAHLFNPESKPRLTILHLPFKFLILEVLHKDFLLCVTSELERGELECRVIVIENPCVHVVTHHKVRESVILEVLSVPVGDRRYHEAVSGQLLKRNVLFNFRVVGDFILGHQLCHVQLLFEFVHA